MCGGVNADRQPSLDRQLFTPPGIGNAGNAGNAQDKGIALDASPITPFGPSQRTQQPQTSTQQPGLFDLMQQLMQQYLAPSDGGGSSGGGVGGLSLMA
jgi:hypothetical protein